MNEAIAGIDIGGTKTAVALETVRGEQIAARILPTRRDALETVEQIFQAIEETAAAEKIKLRAVGIGCPSPLDLEKGLVMSPSNLREWNNFPIRKLFQERFQIPIALDNDANCAALGEFVFGAGREFENIVYITVSTGIGGAIIINGEVVHGVAASAGELGHAIVQIDGVQCNCGSRGCLETICAGVHIARRTRERLASSERSVMSEMVANLDEVSAKTLVEAVRLNDELAVEIWDETCRFLAVGIANVVTLIAPEAIVIGGGIAAASGDLLLAPLRRLVPQFVSMIPAEKIKILSAELGGESGVRGAVALAKKAAADSLQNYAV